MSYRIKDPDTGEFITIANGSRMFVGTTAAIDAAIARGELKYPDLYACTDDYPTGADEVQSVVFTPAISGMTFTARDNNNRAHTLYRAGNLLVMNIVGTFAGTCPQTNWYGLVSQTDLDKLLVTGERVEFGYGNSGLTGTGFNDILGIALYIAQGQTSVSVSGQAVGVILKD